MLSSLVILVSLLGSAIGFAIDKYAAVIVVVFIVRSAITILLDSVRVLLDASLDYESLTRIREIALADPRVLEINELRARNAGRYKFVELDVLIIHHDQAGKGPSYALGNAGAEILLTEETDASKAWAAVQSQYRKSSPHIA